MLRFYHSRREDRLSKWIRTGKLLYFMNDRGYDILLSKLDLMELQAKALFTHDDNGFIREINDMSRAPALRFFLGRTLEGSVLRFRYDLPRGIIRKIEELVTLAPMNGDRQMDTALLEKLKEILREHQEVQKMYEGPAYTLPRGTIVANDVLKITKDNVSLLKDGFDYMLTELPYWEPCFVKFVDGNAASICFSSRIASGSHEAGTETLPRFRGKGYAAEAVAAWAAAIYEMNRIPIYSTSWENTASQSVARKLQCEMYGIDLSIY